MAILSEKATSLSWIYRFVVTGGGGLGDECSDDSDCNAILHYHCNEEAGICTCADEYELDVETLLCGEPWHSFFVSPELKLFKSKMRKEGLQLAVVLRVTSCFPRTSHSYRMGKMFYRHSKLGNFHHNNDWGNCWTKFYLRHCSDYEVCLPTFVCQVFIGTPVGLEQCSFTSEIEEFGDGLFHLKRLPVLGRLRIQWTFQGTVGYGSYLTERFSSHPALLTSCIPIKDAAVDWVIEGGSDKAASF